jgi:hypothetical protein
MSAFQAYAGAYEFGGASYRWQCYATTRVYDVRKREHGPFPPAPHGKKWVSLESRRNADLDLTWLVDETTADFSQILAQVEPRRGQRAFSAPIAAASV